MLRLSVKQWNTIINGLRVAAERFDGDAAAAADLPRVRNQFQQQAEEARVLADFIENTV